MNRLPEDPGLDPPHEDEEEAMKNDLILDVEDEAGDIDDALGEIRDKLAEYEDALNEAQAAKDRVEELLDGIVASLAQIDKSIERNR